MNPYQHLISRDLALAATIRGCGGDRRFEFKREFKRDY
jgi:hypothetical protein